MHKAVQLITDLDQRYDLGLCHGLAPNPFGFTFEATGKLKIDKLVSKLLTSIELDDEATRQLLNYMRGN